MKSCLLTCLMAVVVLCLRTPASVASSQEALLWWEKGKDAILEGQSDRAISCFLLSLEKDPRFPRSYLSLAAAYLDKGQQARAVPYFEQYLLLEPGHTVIRRYLAETLAKLRRPYSARKQFERFVAEAQADPKLAREHLIPCHTRLVELNKELEQPYHEHLNRGIGLYHLAQARREFTSTKKRTVSAESLLCRAARDLKLAHEHRTEAARPLWYLHRVWKSLGQEHTASKCLRQARKATHWGDLTPTERSDLDLAVFDKGAEGSRK